MRMRVKSINELFVLFLFENITLAGTCGFVALRKQTPHLALIPSYVRKIMIMLAEFKISMRTIFH